MNRKKKIYSELYSRGRLIRNLIARLHDSDVFLTSFATKSFNAGDVKERGGGFQNVSVKERNGSRHTLVGFVFRTGPEEEKSSKGFL